MAYGFAMSHEQAYDHWLTNIEDEEPQKVTECSMCGSEIYEGDDYYSVGVDDICERCMDGCKKTAELPEQEDY